MQIKTYPAFTPLLYAEASVGTAGATLAIPAGIETLMLGNEGAGNCYVTFAAASTAGMLLMAGAVSTVIGMPDGAAQLALMTKSGSTTVNVALGKNG